MNIGICITIFVPRQVCLLNRCQTHICYTGSEYGMADLHLYPMFERLPGIAMFGFDVFPAGKFPLLTAWTARMQQLDCVRKVWISPQLHYYQLSEAKKPSVIPYDVEMDKETIAMQNSVVN